MSVNIKIRSIETGRSTMGTYDLETIKDECSGQFTQEFCKILQYFTEVLCKFDQT